MHVRPTHKPKDKRARAASTDTRVVAERLYWLKGATLKNPGSPRRRVHEEGARPTPSVAGSPGRRPMAGVRLGLKDQGSGTSLQTCGRGCG